MSQLVTFGPFSLFPRERRLEHGGQAVKIGSRALDILIALTERAGEVVSREALVARVGVNRGHHESGIAFVEVHRCPMAVVVSSRVLDPRAAQNLAATTVLPLLGLLVVQLAGRIALGPRFYLVLALGVAAADVALVFLAVRGFDRERLLTRWR